MSYKLFYLIAAFSLVTAVPVAFAQFCCDVPVMTQHSSYFECATSTPCGGSCFFCPTVGQTCNGFYGYYYSCIPDEGGDDGPSIDDLDISVNSTCDGNTVFVHDNGNPVDGADVSVVEDISGDPVASGETDEDGLFSFPGCPDNGGLKVKIEASASGYDDELFITTLNDCSQCVAAQCGNNVVEAGEQCDGSDVACSASEECSACQCVPVTCGPCEAVENHSCKNLCGPGESCVNNQCKVPDGSCSTDLQCDTDQFCDIPPGLNTGSCADLCEDDTNFCQCSDAVDHKLVPTGWECGTESGCPSCPSGQQCVDHECVAPDLTCPATGIVGDSKTCDATDCPDCDYVVTLPDGTNATGKTDADGDFGLPLNQEGTYRVTLLQNGTPIKTVEIRALPQAQPEEPEKPTGTSDGDLSWLWILILLILIVVGFLYWRSRGKK